MCSYEITNYLFWHFPFIVFSNVTLPHWPLYAVSIKTMSVFDHFWLFSQNTQPNLDWKHTNDSAKRLKNVAKKKFHLPELRKNHAEKNKRDFSNQSGDVLARFYQLEKLLFTVILQSRGSKSFEKFLETYPGWSTILIKLQALIPQFY